MKGVVAYIKNEDLENLCLVLDDVEAISSSANSDWKHTVLFTSKCYDTKKLRNLALTKEEFAQIGENIVIRLLALRGDIK